MRLGEMVIRFGKALGSSVTDKGVVKISVVGLPGLEDDSDDMGEGNPDADAFGPLGEQSRPLPPDASGEYAEKASFKLHSDDDSTVFSWRDLRLSKLFPAPKEGTISRVHYGGGYWAFDMTPGNAGDQKGSLFTLYVPYAWSGGTPAKAMAVILDAENESLAIIHGDGYAVLMDKDNGILLRASSESWARFKPDDLLVVCESIALRGNVALGANTTVAAPLLPGAASQATPSVFFSPV